MPRRRHIPDLEQVLAELNRESLCVLASVSRKGLPEVSAVSWVRGRPPDQVDIVSGWKSRAVKNLETHPGVSLLLYHTTVLVLTGDAWVEEKLIPDLPIPLALIRVKVQAVHDGMFTGGVLTGGPSYIKDYPVKLSHLDTLVDDYFKQSAPQPVVTPEVRR